MKPASLSLPSVFSDHAVLKPSARTPIRGRGQPGKPVLVSLAGVSARTLVRADGAWSVALDLRSAGEGPHTLVAQCGEERREIVDVLLGEVWFCSGQSNMDLLVCESTHAAGAEAAPPLPRLREFRVRKTASAVPQDDAEGQWIVATPESVPRFGAVSYYFGRKLVGELERPVGIIQSSWGNTPIEPWISRTALHSDPRLAEDERRLRAYFKAQTGDEPEEAVLQARHVPGFLFHTMVAPFRGYGVSGFLWYQGESNVSRAAAYRTAFPLLVHDWRTHWAQGELPFYYCQIANYGPKSARPGESTWAELREAQERTLSVAATGEAVLIDAGEEADIHPRDKRTAGERLAAIALANSYHREVPFSGPRYDSLEIRGGEAHLRFRHSQEGLFARELPATYRLRSTGPTEATLLRNSPGSELEGFAICGADRCFHWAQARIEGETVIVSSPEVPEPVAVRYAWADNPTCNLYNAAGLPAAPFRTDDFPLSTEGGRYLPPGAVS
ncbi:MAG TPA: sialate O-acetylesterase [Chthoniobacteraceae bacterium]|nr:sialate O-acetylesterase [Chthoniobacteraceae bacterium]